MNEQTRITPQGDRPERLRKPDWIRVKAPTSAGYHETRRLMRDLDGATLDHSALYLELCDLNGKGNAAP